jgi:outer membrane protein
MILNMKKLGFIVLLMAFANGLQAQKFGFVDSEYILKHIPEYSTAQKAINNLSDQYKKEVDNKFQDLDRAYKAYQKDQVLLSDDMRKKREEEIVAKEKAAKDFQKQKFGPEGELFKSREALIKPIQDRIFKAIQAVAEEGDYGIIFDKNSEPTMLYSAPRYDKSNDVILRLGLKPGVFAK